MALEDRLTSKSGKSTEERAVEKPAPLTGRRRLPGLVGIGTVIVSVVALFLYLGGWFSPRALTPARFAEALERVDGIHPGFRRNHAKGVSVSGFFESNGKGQRLSKGVIFRPGRMPMIGRFSFGGGDPYVADAPDTVRGLGLSFRCPTGRNGGLRWSVSLFSR